MEERSWTQRIDREMAFSIRRSSHDRYWSGFVAIIYDTTGGYDETHFVNHSVTMHLGPPVFVTTDCDGSVEHRLQIPGDVKIVPAGFSRRWEVERASSKLAINLCPSLVYDVAEQMGANPDRVSIAPQLHVTDPHIEHIGWALKAELEAADPLGRLYADSLGVALAAHLVRRYMPAVPKRIAGGLSKRSLLRVTDYVRENIAHDLTLAELARVAHLSPSHFKVLFKQSVGLPVHRYVVRTRVDFAAELLREGRLPSSDVALEAGFANQSHMARCMRRVSGLTPTVLRKGR